MVFVNFHKIDVFEKSVKKNIDFGVVFGCQNHKKSVKNRVWNYSFFWHRFCSRFFVIFHDFCGFWEALGAPKNHKKIEKIEKVAFGTLFKFLMILGAILGVILGGFWEDFKWILGGFWMDFLNYLEGFYKQWLGRPRENQ